MKLQTSIVLGTSYAIAKLAPKRDKQTFLLDDSKWTITLEPNSLIPPK